MGSKLFLRAQAQALPLFTFFPEKPSFRKFLVLSLSYSSSTAGGTANNGIPLPELSYGPSLHKGAQPAVAKSQSLLRNFDQPSLQEVDGGEDDCLLDEESFTRVFEITALRVPSKDCFALESRLRGHLLNWPRIRNIARVPGDDVDVELVELVGNQNEDDEDGDALVSLNRRIHGRADGDGEPLSPILYREKLVKTFVSRGYVNFRNLARMTRQKKRKKKREEEKEEGKRMNGKNELAVVEVVEDEEQCGEEFKGLLGADFKGRKWSGPTRLLLLDERYAGRSPEELPEAIKVLFQHSDARELFVDSSVCF